MCAHYQKGIAPIIIILIIAVAGFGTYQAVKVNNKKKTIEESAKEQQKEEKKEERGEITEKDEAIPQSADKLQETINGIAIKFDQIKQLVPNVKIETRNISNCSYKYGLVGYDFLEEKVDAKCIMITGTYDYSLDSVKKANNIFLSIFKDWKRNDYMEGSATIKWSNGYIKPADKIFCSIFGSSDGYDNPVSKITEEICCGYYKNEPRDDVTETPQPSDDEVYKVINQMHTYAKTLVAKNPIFVISDIKQSTDFVYFDMIPKIKLGQNSKIYNFVFNVDSADTPNFFTTGDFKILQQTGSKFIDGMSYINKDKKIVCLEGYSRSFPYDSSGFGGYFEIIAQCASYESIEPSSISANLRDFMNKIYAEVKLNGVTDKRFAIREIKTIDYTNSIAFSFDQSNEKNFVLEGFIKDPNGIDADGPQGTTIGYINNGKKISCVVNKSGRNTASYTPANIYDHEYTEVSISCSDMK